LPGTTFAFSDCPCVCQPDAARLTVKYRRLRGDMIETYKILSGKYDVRLLVY